MIFQTLTGSYRKDVFKEKNGSIDINKFAIAFEQLEDPFKLEEKIFNKTGIKPNIILSGESWNGIFKKSE